MFKFIDYNKLPLFFQVANTQISVANATAIGRFGYRGFTADMAAVPQARRGPIASYICQQIDLIESLAIDEPQKAWFRSVPIAVDPRLNEAGRYSGHCLSLDDSTSPPGNPVLLHEMLHAYQAVRMSTAGDLRVRLAYLEALILPDYAGGGYMLTNVHEFWAMTASVALWGKAARPPSVRATVRRAQPEYYAWIVQEFGLRAP